MDSDKLMSYLWLIAIIGFAAVVIVFAIRQWNNPTCGWIPVPVVVP
jgi:hypothetical protein